ncbi:MAG: hypothetical protein R3323_07845, partial [Wenzhouxiangellaceae bacterium]|nr:hypothetical protein [Wenzhouxiangellaceae bacterium]
MLHKNNTRSIAALLRDEPERLHEMTVETPHWRLDCARIPVALDDWRARFDDSADEERRAALELLFSGGIVNPSEQRPALHMALRASDPTAFAGDDAARSVAAQRRRMEAIAGELHAGCGIDDLLHVGIGGSDLGPRLVADALDEGRSAVRVHWLATLDERRLARLLDGLDPRRTGVVVASKSFGTVETRLQATAIRDWMGEGFGARAWAATSKTERAVEFGIPPENVLEFPEAVGGRFSLWSGVGLSAAALVGPRAWSDLLEGAERLDARLRDEPAASLATSLAEALDALVRGAGAESLGVVSYEPRLALLAEYLQQLVMESLGKSWTDRDRHVAHPTAPLVFGGAGTDLQHSLFQALHQGPRRHPVLLIGCAAGDGRGPGGFRDEQLAHLLGQASALVHGRDDADPERRLPGDNPVLVMLGRSLDATSLGE